MAASHLRRAARVAALAGALVLVPASASFADTVVPNNQIVQGYQCLGTLCADGEPMSGGLFLLEKAGDTPGIRLQQTNANGFTPQTWDMGGNEANFFIRDLTGGSRLPFRIRPGAPTSSIDIGASGAVSTAGVVQQSLSGLTPTAPLDGDAALAAIRNLTISTYAVGGAAHALPDGAAFRAAFGLGASDSTLAPQDEAAIALAAIRALDARVTGISLTPGAKGDKGDAGAAGAKGDTGAQGAPGDLPSANARIAALEKTNAKLTRSVTGLQRQVRALIKGAKHKTRNTRAHAAAGNGR